MNTLVCQKGDIMETNTTSTTDAIDTPRSTWMFHSPEQVNHEARKRVEELSTPPMIVFIPRHKAKVSVIDFVLPVVGIGMVVAIYLLKY